MSDLKSCPVIDENQWHLDKRVPVAIILALLIQSGSIIWWASQTDARLRALETQTQSSSLYDGRIIRVEQLATTNQARLIRIEDKLDRIIENGAMQR